MLSTAARVTGINAVTKAKGILKLETSPDLRKIKMPRQPQLPKAAMEGLKFALSTCSRPPKQLQYEADVMCEKLANRRFPASSDVIKGARREILKKMDEKGLGPLDEAVYGQKINKAHTQYVNAKVGKLLRQSSYNWKPLDLESREKAAAYALATLSPSFSEIYRVLCEFDHVKDFKPHSVLDFGSGIGAAFWACNEKFKDNVDEYTLVDTSENMSRFSMDIMRKNEGATGKLAHQNVNFRRSLVPSLETKYDLVIAHRVLIEYVSRESRLELIESLWKRTKRYLVLIESHFEDNFKAILDARDYLIREGQDINFDKVDFNQFGGKTDSKLSSYENYHHFKANWPKDKPLPTFGDPATVFAPCPHDLECPKLGLLNARKQTCSFNVKYQDIRADGKASKKRNGTGSTSFSYMILEKGERQTNVDSGPRLLNYCKGNGHFTCQGCTAFNGIQHYVISKKNKSLFEQTKGLNVGDKIPYNISVEKGLSDDTELFEGAINVQAEIDKLVKINDTEHNY
uniref:Methyltransferase-like protein 17, mitochondrial n=1 Tax=Rhabditophanes sp. KR3021 TaxID=114890 RepID=A0AC35U003_9BILA